MCTLFYTRKGRFIKDYKKQNVDKIMAYYFMLIEKLCFYLLFSITNTKFILTENCCLLKIFAIIKFPPEKI